MADGDPALSNLICDVEHADVKVSEPQAVGASTVLGHPLGVLVVLVEDSVGRVPLGPNKVLDPDHPGDHIAVAYDLGLRGSERVHTLLAAEVHHSALSHQHAPPPCARKSQRGTQTRS